MTVRICPASDYTIQEMVDIYNLTRSDYLVPMAMIPADLEEYLQVYDIALDGSMVALQDGRPVGLNLLGQRGEQGWITRLGVAPQARRRGVARALMQALLAEAGKRGVKHLQLEVIADNQPGRALFQSFGFAPRAEYIVGERPKTVHTVLPARQVAVDSASHDDMLDELARREGHVDWKNHPDSLSKLVGLKGIKVTAEIGSAWVIFRPKNHRLEKTILNVHSGHPSEIGTLMLDHLSKMYPGCALKAENVPAEGLTWDAYQSAGFEVSFRRVEMWLTL
jgi:ribosomal protein S18 acetylase RimI-like enzyme